jgi:hypothetical protein
MAKYFIHNEDHQAIVDELPAGYTPLLISSAERSTAIDPLPLDVIGVPCIIEELNIYTAWNTDTKSDRWQCILAENATTWAEVNAKRTEYLTLNEQGHNDLKAILEE